jgi:asparagine synthase (glutamine-hydrolysing)
MGLICCLRRRNSEIYNHKQLASDRLPGVDMHTTSDSALLGYMYKKEGKITHEMLDSLDGIFATTVLDGRTGHFVAARDPMGICPMYWGKGADGSTWFASEMKALHDVCETFEIFPPVWPKTRAHSMCSMT